MQLVPVAFLVLAAAAPVAADETTWYPIGADCVTTAASDDARRALAAYWFEQGTAEVDAGRFLDAMRSFACSQRIIPHPSTLFNLARAAEWADKPEVALRALREYLATAPDAPNRAEAEELERSIAAALERPDDESQPPPPPPPPPADGQDDVQEDLGWTSVALAAAAAAAGAAMGGLAAHEQDRIENVPDGTRWTEVAEREEQRDTYLVAMGACLGGAAAAALAGILLLVLDQDEPPPVEITPVAAPEGTGLVLTWTF